MHNVRNVAPAGRKAGRLNREYVEKLMLAQRQEGHVRYDFDEIINPLKIDENAQAFMPASQQFHTDTAGEEKKLRDLKNARKEQQIAARRLDRMQRDQQRWREMEEEYQNEEAKFARYREEGTKYKCNSTSVPYDPITLGYSESQAGQMLKYQDERIMYRAALRKRELQKKRDGFFNPITGEPKRPVYIPPSPVRPDIAPEDNRPGGRYQMKRREPHSNSQNPDTQVAFQSQIHTPGSQNGGYQQFQQGQYPTPQRQHQNQDQHHGQNQPSAANGFAVPTQHHSQQPHHQTYQNQQHQQTPQQTRQYSHGQNQQQYQQPSAANGFAMPPQQHQQYSSQPLPQQPNAANGFALPAQHQGQQFNQNTNSNYNPNYQNNAQRNPFPQRY